jgi:hypothetical protein
MNSNLTAGERNVQQVFSGDRVIHISYDNLIPGEYEKRVIFGNLCGSLTGMRCIFEGRRADVFYITGGLCRFDDYIKKEAENTQSFLGIILEILKAVRECGNYLIPENELSLKPENIFFSEMNGSVKLLYMPGFRRKASLAEEMAMLTDRAEKVCHFGMLQRDIISEYRSELLRGDNDTDSMISITEEAMRRTFIPSVPDSIKAADGEKKVMVMESGSDYGAGGIIKRHLKDFINELVS